jgi:N-acetylmuramoyl-L-alanine amidase
MRPVTPVAAVLGAFIAIATPAAVQAQSADQSLECVAEAVYFEARGTGPQSRAAVAHVVLNRAEDDEFPDTPCDVVQDSCQFSYQCDGKPERLTEEEDRLKAIETAKAVLSGAAPDPTDGALFFHAARIDPGWFATLDQTARIGGHIFYR